MDTVLKSIGNPSMVSGMVSRSPSPTSQAAQTQALLGTPSPPPQSAYPSSSSANASASPKLHCLPDNALNPLGLLVEASLANRRAHGVSSSFSARPANPDPDRKLGVASDNYFRPGSHFFFARCLLFQIGSRPNDHTPPETLIHRAADSTRDAELR